MIIYKTTNNINGKYYIGQDSKNNPNYIGSGLLLTKAIKKYGKNNFTKEILEVCETKEELNEREKYWIKTFSATTIGYNISEGGAGGDMFNCLSDEDKIKNIKIKSYNAKIKNIMKEKNVFECWVDKYGEEKSKELIEEYKNKQRIINLNRYRDKKNEDVKKYSDFILESFKTMTLDEIHTELFGLVSKKIIREILIDNGINLYSRKGVNKGQQNGQAKLSCKDVVEIKELVKTKTIKEIAKSYRISVTQIYQVIKGVTYKNCGPYEPQHTKGSTELKKK